jgi:4-hydroxy-2-oxoheptanedioate aldolase
VWDARYAENRIERDRNADGRSSAGAVDHKEPAMNSTQFTKKLRAGEPLFGTLIVSPSPMWPAALEGSGLDFVFIDTEHIALDRAQVSWMCQAYARMGLPPLVRIPSPDPYEATKMLDGGAAGIIAPYVETVEQVQALRGAVKLRPVKGRRLADRLAGGPFEPTLEDYVRGRNTNAMVVNIESVPAIEALDEILAVPDLDAVLIGPHDLSCSLGIPEQYRHPRFQEAVYAILRKARAAKGPRLFSAAELRGFAGPRRTSDGCIQTKVFGRITGLNRYGT